MFGLFCAVALIWLLNSLVFATSLDAIFKESGPLEQLSALYFLAAALWLSASLIRQPDRWHLALLTLAAGLRELDWDKRFTDSGILSLRLYAGDFPLPQKAAGALALAILISAGLQLVRRDLRPWLTALMARKSTAWMLLSAIALICVAKSLDGLGRKLAPFGIEVSVAVGTVAARAEEGMEMFASILVLQAVIMARRRPD